MSEYADIGLNVYKVRCMCHLTQTEFAERIGVSSALVSLWEKGGRTPTADHLKTISEKCEVSMDFLINAPRWIPVFQI